MEALFALLAFTQAIGALIGAGGGVFAELYYFRAMKDGRVDEAERSHMRVLATTLRIGMIVVLLSSISLVILDFVYLRHPQPALTATYWTQMLIAIGVIVASWALSRKRISFVWGSAIVFTGWWYLACLSLGQMPLMSLGSALALYLVSTVIMAGLLSYARMMSKPADENIHTTRPHGQGDALGSVR